MAAVEVGTAEMACAELAFETLEARVNDEDGPPLKRQRMPQQQIVSHSSQSSSSSSSFVRHMDSVLTTADVAAYRDETLRQVKASSLHRQFCIIKHAAKIAEEEWGWDARSHIFNAIKIKRTLNRRQEII